VLVINVLLTTQSAPYFWYLWYG